MGKVEVPRDCYCKNGRTSETEERTTDLPRGVSEGATVSVPGGESLLVSIPYVHSWQKDYVDYTGFDRDGDDLVFTKQVTKTQLRKGFTFEIETLAGHIRDVKVPAGSSEDYRVTLARCGMPKKDGKEFGDLHVKLDLRTR